MEYQVPQFIDVEDKVVGPFTLKQFIYLAGGAGLCVVFFSLFPIGLAIILALPAAGLAGALAFYKVNGKSFIQILEAGFRYYTGAKLFLWKKEEQRQAAPVAQNTAPVMPKASGPRLTRGKLQDLAWSLDVKDTSASEPK